MRHIIALSLLLGFAIVINVANLSTGLAQEVWLLEEVTDGSVPEDIIPDTREVPRDGIPDGRIAVPDRERDILEAWYAQPTGRYPHGALGDTIEGGALKVRLANRSILTFILPRTEVFEDLTPRLVDLDRDGTTEVVTILSSTRRGASVAVFGLVGNALVKKAQTDFLGRRFRWLNIAGIERFRGLPTFEIAVVEKPHLEGVLRFYRYRNGSLGRSQRGAAFSNHELGSTELRLSAITDLNNDNRADLIIPSFDRRTLFVIGLSQSGFQQYARIELPAAVNRAIAVEGVRNDIKITVGLDDGKIYTIRRQ